MDKENLIKRIRNADINELNKLATEHKIAVISQCQRKNPSNSNSDYGQITIELCARKKELTESKKVGEEYRKCKLSQHFSTANEFLEFSVNNNIISEKDAKNIQKKPQETLHRLYDEGKVTLKWLMEYGNKFRKESKNS